MRRRGNPSPVGYRDAMLLQRGRRTDAAEGAARHRSHRCAHCFNGAAARMRRRGGIHSDAELQRYIAWLQRGRRTDAAEGGVVGRTVACRSGFNGAAARMRRRAVTIVVGVLLLTVRFNGAAARMRRRACGSGNPRRRWCCFNGAAARMRRRGWAKCSKTSKALCGFNGAAARMRRREARALVPNLRRRRMLQRGRRTDAAEGLQAASHLDALALLQRGRRTDAAEGARGSTRRGDCLRASTGPPHGCGGGECAPRSPSKPTCPLQRGRRTDAAEGRISPVRFPRRPVRFNGAAARMRRRGRCGVTMANVATLLQRGRRTDAAEGARAETLCNQSSVVLQRGRRTDAAEGCGPRG